MSRKRLTELMEEDVKDYIEVIDLFKEEYGADTQIVIFIEECAELQQEIINRVPHLITRDIIGEHHVIEELIDVKTACNTMLHVLDVDDTFQVRSYKPRFGRDDILLLLCDMMVNATKVLRGKKENIRGLIYLCLEFLQLSKSYLDEKDPKGIIVKEQLATKLDKDRLFSRTLKESEKIYTINNIQDYVDGYTGGAVEHASQAENNSRILSTEPIEWDML